MDYPSRSQHVLARFQESCSMGDIRSVLQTYLRQSPSHFELALEVHECKGAPYGEGRLEQKCSPDILNILIEGNSSGGRTSIPLTCQVALIEHSAKAGSMRRTVATHNGGAQPLERFLTSLYPIIDAPLQQDTMWRWWQSNGKTFNWVRLPTELKEHIIKHCLHQPHSFGMYSNKLTQFDQRYKNRRSIRRPGPHEIVQQLGDWFQLLYVSHQVRTITLRLCIAGGNGLTYSSGLCITTSSLKSFAERLDRLGDHYQMVQSDSVPTTTQEKVWSKCYDRFPHIYPELGRYATFRHGIQNISLSMNFISFIHFFKVQIGGSQQIHKSRGPTYEVFERMPNLREIVIRLPLRPRGGWINNPSDGGPPLFHHEKPCPRALHRLIYEHAAKALARYDNVTLRHFIDDGERQRFLGAREQGVKALNFTKVELGALYADDGGGVDLGVAERQVDLPIKRPREEMKSGYAGGLTQTDFFPPFCSCDEPCALSPALY